MKISDKDRQTIISALHVQRNAVIAERKRDAEDYSVKWNDFRESRAIGLDAERDKLGVLIEQLSAESGALEWP